MSELINAILLPADNGAEPIPVGISGLESIQQLVGGHIDAVVAQADPADFEVDGNECEIVGYVHDEGILLGLPLNRLATVMFGRELYGPVVVTGTDNQGNDAELPEWFLGAVFGGGLVEAVELLNDGARMMRSAFEMAIEDGLITKSDEVELLFHLMGQDADLARKAASVISNVMMYYNGVRSGELERIVPDVPTSTTLTDEDIYNWLEGSDNE